MVIGSPVRINLPCTLIQKAVCSIFNSFRMARKGTGASVVAGDRPEYKLGRFADLAQGVQRVGSVAVEGRASSRATGMAFVTGCRPR